MQNNEVRNYYVLGFRCGLYYNYYKNEVCKVYHQYTGQLVHYRHVCSLQNYHKLTRQWWNFKFNSYNSTCSYQR